MLYALDDIDNALVLLMEMLYTALGRNRISWYHPDPSQWTDAVSREIRQIQRLWDHFDFVVTDPVQRTHYIQRQQLVLLHCLRWLERMEGDNPPEAIERLRIMCECATHSLQDLLEILVNRFKDHLKMELFMPGTLQARAIYRMKNELPALQKKLSGASADQQLAKLIVAHFSLFIRRSPSFSYSFGQLLMMEDWMAELMLSQYRTTGRLMIRACHWNCNSTALFQFGRQWFTKLIEERGAVAYRYKLLSGFFAAIMHRPGYCWDKDQKPLGQTLAVYFLERNDSPMQSAESKDASQQVEKRLQVELTAEQLGLFLQLCKEAGLLKVPQNSTLIRFVMQHVSTVGKDPKQELSYEYLKRSMVNSSMSCFEMVEEILNDMLVRLRKRRVEQRRKERRPRGDVT